MELFLKDKTYKFLADCNSSDRIGKWQLFNITSETFEVQYTIENIGSL